MVPRLLTSLAICGLLMPAFVAAKPAAQGGETILTESVRDFNADGAPDTLTIVMRNGRRFNDRRTWCGGGDKYQGDFEIRVRMANGPATTYRLVGYSFFRPGEWSVYFADYNDDGRVDFNLGQYGGCNGWRYQLFTVDSSGRVRELQTTGAPLPVSDFANSTNRIIPVEGGFENCFYHSAFGHLVERYRWNEDKGVFLSAGQRLVDSCPARK